MELDTDRSGGLSKQDVVRSAKKLGMTPDEAALLFEELDADKSGELDRAEFINGFRKRRITFASASFWQKIIIMLFYGRRQSGAYYPVASALTNSSAKESDKKDENHDEDDGDEIRGDRRAFVIGAGALDAFFSKFTPGFHKYYCTC